MEIIKGTSSGIDRLSIKVTNKEYSDTIKSTNQILRNFQDTEIINNTYSQGSGNTQSYEGMINANSINPLRIGMYIPEGTMTDEFGNITAIKLQISYEINKFRSDIGTSSASDNSTGIDTYNTANDTGVYTNNEDSDLVVDNLVDSDTSILTVANYAYSTPVSITIPSSLDVDFICVCYTVEFLTGADTGNVDVMIYNVTNIGSDYNIMSLSNQIVYRPEGSTFLTDAWLSSSGSPPCLFGRL